MSVGKFAMESMIFSDYSGKDMDKFVIFLKCTN